MKHAMHLHPGSGMVSRLGHLFAILLMVLVASEASAKDRVVYFHNDALGSPVAATGESGQILWREDYAPYGERLLHEDEGSNRLWYTGKEEDEALGLYYYGARWYDADIGRFLSLDPAGFAEGNPQSFNRYAYANNNPYRFVDPDGRWALFVNSLRKDLSPESAMAAAAMGHTAAVAAAGSVGAALTAVAPGPEDLVIGSVIGGTLVSAWTVVS
jgi:RHS repeat-associated protein